jgi:hypothetical protein
MKGKMESQAGIIGFKNLPRFIVERKFEMWLLWDTVRHDWYPVRYGTKDEACNSAKQLNK